MSTTNDKNKAETKICKNGRTCHTCKTPIKPGEKYVESGYKQCYSNICKSCIKRFAKEV